MYTELSKELEKTKLELNRLLENKSIFYLTRDPERGTGLEDLIENFHLVHIQRTQYLDYFDKIGLKYFCLESDPTEMNKYKGSSRIVLNSSRFIEYYEKNKNKKGFVQTFKISPAFEMKTKSFEMQLLNSSSILNRRFEDKISQYEHLSRIVQFPKTIILRVGELSYLQLVQKLGDIFVIQFSRGHTGSGTYIIESENDYENVLAFHRHRVAKFSSYISGIAYTVNACATKAGVFIGGLSLQITGESELTSTRGATIGNDWSKRIYLTSTTEIEAQVRNIGKEMYRQGFRGMFGVDVVVNEFGESFIIEVNARQTASIPMYTKIQLMNGELPLSLLHLMEYLGMSIEIDSETYNIRNLNTLNFSQVFIRADSDTKIKHLVKMGSYRLQGDNAAINRYTDEVESSTLFLDEDRDKALLYQGYVTNIASMESQSLIVLTPEVGREIKKGEEIGRIQLMQSSVDDSGNVHPWAREALKAIKYNQI